MFDYNKRTYIMGILNVTPDSFSDGGKFNSVDEALKYAIKMVEEGADIIDLGGESTRPGHSYVDADEELRRVIPVIKKLKEELDTPISVDTYKAKVADESLKLGVEMINDVWGLTKDKDMASVIAKHNAYVCIMHNQDDTEYDKDIMESIKEFLLESINIAIDLHRDGRDLKTDADIQKEHERMSITYKGEKVAKFFFVVGMRNPNVNEVKSLAEDITKFAKTKYPELVLSVVEKPVGKFNQYMAQNHMLIEVGSNGTSSEEAKASAKYIAEILDEYFKQNR